MPLEEVNLVLQFLQEILPPFLFKIITDPDLSWRMYFILLGVVFGAGFGKKLDQGIMNSEWYNELKEKPRWSIPGEAIQNIVKRVLDITHHWWIGWGMMILFGRYHRLPEEAWYFGLGLLIDDLKDIPFRHGILERDNDGEDPA